MRELDLIAQILEGRHTSNTGTNVSISAAMGKAQAALDYLKEDRKYGGTDATREQSLGMRKWIKDLEKMIKEMKPLQGR